MGYHFSLKQNYIMKNRNWGCVVIVNNCYFKTIKEKDENGKNVTKLKLPTRYGSHKDEEALETLFKQLHFDVIIHRHRSSQVLTNTIY